MDYTHGDIHSTVSTAVVDSPTPQQPINRAIEEYMEDITCAWRIVEEKFKVEVAKVEPCEELDPHGSTKSYKVELRAPTAEAGEVPMQAGTARTPYNMRRLIIQFKSTWMAMSDSYWATNKVAAMKLARDILYNTPFDGAVPDVYYWNDGRDRPGEKAWVIQGAAPRCETLTRRFNRSDENEQKAILEQIAQLQRYFQGYKMPRSYGSCALTSTGQIRAGPLEQPFLGGPFGTTRDMMRAELQLDLAKAQSHRWLRGWEGEPQLRKQLDEFMTHSMDKMLSEILDDEPIFTLNKLGKFPIINPNPLNATNWNQSSAISCATNMKDA